MQTRQHRHRQNNHGVTHCARSGRLGRNSSRSASLTTDSFMLGCARHRSRTSVAACEATRRSGSPCARRSDENQRDRGAGEQVC
jgi:hypothetical protein